MGAFIWLFFERHLYRATKASLSPLPLDLGHLADRIADLVTVKFGDGGNAVNVPQEVIGRAQECFERRVAVTSTEHMVIRGDDHFDQPRRCPVLPQQTSQDRLEVVAYLHSTQFEGATLADLLGLTDDGVGPKDIKT